MLKTRNIMGQYLYICAIVLCTILLTACSPEDISKTFGIASDYLEYGESIINGRLDQKEPTIELGQIPEYTGDAVAIINDNNPQFKELIYESYEYYSELDYLGRCQVAHASLGLDLMPTQDRESISNVKPTGWLNKEYEIVEGGYLYNRCHLIGFQLAGENANNKNLITGTRYMNTPIMLKYENAVADYIKETGNHVMYRVTPMYEGKDLVAKGLQIEGYSVEDNGDGVCFNVFIYNEQPGIIIDHTTGESWIDTEKIDLTVEKNEAEIDEGEVAHVLNTNSLKIHQLTCGSVKKINDENKKYSVDDVEILFAQGYTLCGSCY